MAGSGDHASRTHATTGDFLITSLAVLLTGWVMIGFRLQIMLTRELSQARETVAKLAANEERLRLARDMHDLTGQSLSLVTLKSDLARKMLSRLPQTRERDAALSEVDDIGRVSRQTLRDIREAVSGYRRPTLAVEIITSRTALESAGIALDDDPGLTLRSGTFDADAEAALAWCLREAVTNVIRHSGAKNCRIQLTHQDGEVSLEVSDDGRGLSGLAERPATDRSAGDGGQDGQAAASRSARPAGDDGQDGADRPESEEITMGGTGLRGMSERLAGIGGRLTPGQAGASGRGFRLVATVPETGALASGDGQPGEALTRAAATAPHASAARAGAQPGEAVPQPGAEMTDRAESGGAGPSGGPAPRIRVLLAEDQAMIRQALAALLSYEDDIEVVAQVGRGDEVVAAAAQHDVEVALLDIEMPGMDGLTAAAELRRAKPDVKIVILTTFGRPGFLRRAMESGVSAFLVKDSPADKLAATIRRVLAGGRVIDPDLAAAALAEGVNPLTQRERDVLAASADGSRISEIAASLYLSEGTVRNYLSACIQKTGARNRVEALRIADKRGWLSWS